MLTLKDGELSASCFIAPHPRLRPYLTTYYFTVLESADGDELCDWMNPEWASVRYAWRGQTRGSVHPDPMQPIPLAHFVGPTTRAGPFAARVACVASIGFLPLGWCRFMREPANNWANRIGAAGDVNAIIPMADLWGDVVRAGEPQSIAALFDRILLAALDAPPLVNQEEEARIGAAHSALIDPDMASVAALGERLGLAPKQLHRLSRRIFGFPPKLLMRRQRFIRTLGQWFRDPHGNWSDALDLQYYDCSHFNRDFRAFFGMSPDQYRRLPHPIIGAAMRARLKALGQPLQALQAPG
ncbi:MAG: helix-turn-helix domain-containing protein [Sphingopyxis sp.]